LSAAAVADVDENDLMAAVRDEVDRCHERPQR